MKLLCLKTEKVSIKLNDSTQTVSVTKKNIDNSQHINSKGLENVIKTKPWTNKKNSTTDF